jgi:hypothetical protein
MHRTTFGRLTSVLILAGAMVVAVALVSTPLTDHSTACGTAIDAAWHGVHLPQPAPPASGDPLGAGPNSFGTNGPAVVCRNVARERIAASAAVLGIAVVGVDARRRRRSEPARNIVTTAA